MLARRLGRVPAVAMTCGAGLVLFALTLPTWAVAASPTAVELVQVAVPGTRAAPGVASAALVIVVAGLVLGLAGRLARVLAIAAIVIGAGVALAATVRLLAGPASAVRGEVAQTSGVTQIVGQVDLTAFPVLAAAAAAVVLLLGAAAPWLIGDWGLVGRRFQTRADPVSRGGPVKPATGRTQAMDDWDSISRGEDPSGDGQRDPAAGSSDAVR
ncbi:MAG: Trp biosynthesis-associated membrane protein [Beutenbergiaceae bacterium]